MIKALVAVDGSTASLRAVEHAIRLVTNCAELQLVLLNVQPDAEAWELKSHLPAGEIEAMRLARGGDALAAARQRLEAARVRYVPEVLSGPVAATIIACAASHGCDGILLGNKGETFLEEILIGSIAHEVLRLSSLPVTFIK